MNILQITAMGMTITLLVLLVIQTVATALMILTNDFVNNKAFINMMLETIASSMMLGLCIIMGIVMASIRMNIPVLAMIALTILTVCLFVTAIIVSVHVTRRNIKLWREE